MRKCINLSVIGIVAAMIVIASPLASAVVMVPLIAGQFMDVGSVTVDDDGEFLYVKFVVNEGVELIETHVYVGQGEPESSAPGRFPYKNQGDSYKIPLGDLSGTIYIAAHAVVDLSQVCVDCIPFHATLRAYCPGFLGYLDVEINDSPMQKAWCVDTDHLINCYEIQKLYGDVIGYSSYSPEGAALIDIPENIGALNYLLNHDDGYEINDIQRAIWGLIDDFPEQGLLYDYFGDNEWKPNQFYHPDIVNALVNEALENNDYIPECGDIYAVVVKILNVAVEKQIIVIECNVPCGEETAWGDGYRFGKKKNWAMCFEYIIGQ